jgi:hypothetical protein
VGQLSILGLPRLEFHLFSGQQNDRNSDLITGSTGKDLLFGGNFFRLAPNVLAGLKLSFSPKPTTTENSGSANTVSTAPAVRRAS